MRPRASTGTDLHVGAELDLLERGAAQVDSGAFEGGLGLDETFYRTNGHNAPIPRIYLIGCSAAMFRCELRASGRRARFLTAYKLAAGLEEIAQEGDALDG